MKLENPFKNGENSTRINEKLIKSACEYLDFVDSVNKEIGEQGDISMLCYRGVKNDKYDLIPSIYRKGIYDSALYKHFDVSFFHNMEKNFVHLFGAKCASILSHKKDISAWELYELMQHYRMPTRLLDWSSSSLVALFFAVDQTNVDETPCVWLMNPCHLTNLTVTNCNSLNSNKYMNIWVTLTDPVFKLKQEDDLNKFVNKYLEIGDDLPIYPFSIMPKYIDNRIIAQKSIFTIHGSKMTPLNKMKWKEEELQFYKLRIEPSKAPKIKSDLHSMGIDRSTLFPDLEGLANTIKWEHHILNE